VNDGGRREFDGCRDCWYRPPCTFHVHIDITRTSGHRDATATPIPHHSIRQLTQPILGPLHRSNRTSTSNRRDRRRRAGIDQLTDRQTMRVHRRRLDLAARRWLR
jgi:hypothetical protein